MKDLIPTERIEQTIFLIRGQKVILADDLSRLYGVTTKRLNEQVKRNRKRFPGDFIFQLKLQEVRALRSHFATLNPQPVDSDKDSPNYGRSASNSSRHIGAIYSPWAFTEHGAIMAAMVLQSPRAVEMSVHVVRAFVRLRELLATNKDLAQKLAELERRVESHDVHIQSLFEAIRRLRHQTRPSPAASASGRRGGARTRALARITHENLLRRPILSPGPTSAASRGRDKSRPYIEPNHWLDGRGTRRPYDRLKTWTGRV